MSQIAELCRLNGDLQLTQRCGPVFPQFHVAVRIQAAPQARDMQVEIRTLGISMEGSRLIPGGFQLRTGFSVTALSPAA